MDTLTKLSRYASSHQHVQQSLTIIEEAFRRYRLEETCISFNGGKDCTAVLHLVHSVARRPFAQNWPSNNNDYDEQKNKLKLRCFYAKLANHFEEEEKFVDTLMNEYNLELLQYSAPSIKSSLTSLKNDASEIKAIFIGTRRDDMKPGARIEPFAPTDKDWPEFMRINPILDWSYNQVWSFIRDLDIPYCDLYNQGYSSLGTRSDTVKNFNLLRYDDKGRPFYLPAWSLTRSQEERLSRSDSLDTTNVASDKTPQEK